jgi:hypothetical protein
MLLNYVAGTRYLIKHVNTVLAIMQLCKAMGEWALFSE